MAKQIKMPKHAVGRIITTKSAFGSHSDMIVPCDDPRIKDLKLTEEEVICKDDAGYYITKKEYINSGLADPNRYGGPESRKLFQTLTESTNNETANTI
jgi:hypothetical protein